MFHRDHRIPTLILRTSRFFAEEDDNRSVRESFADDNIKANEFVSRRVDIEDAVAAHCCALRQAASLGFGRYIISATTPFTPDDLPELRRDAQAVFRRRLPELVATYEQRGWSMFPTIDRVYDNAKARRELLWQPQYDVTTVMRRLDHGQPLLSDLATTIGKKGYHEESFADGPYPTA
ncbi:hypothetical protein [Rhodopirellula sp. MGV]|uniref:hypothetical protein n=1 Tax=Rhodopirellula sp. MGV TaxID=2023130 RepID=UPI0039658804